MRVQGPDGKIIEFPDGTPPDTIKAVMARHYGGGAPRNGELFKTPPLTRRLATRFAGVAPAVGGFVGGLGGTLAGGVPGAIGGAAVGGAAGEGFRQMYTGQGFSPQEIGLRGAEQAGVEALGLATGGLVRAAARPLMRRAMSLGKPIAGEVKVAGRMFPDPVETALEKGVSVSPKGALKATELAKQSSRKLTELLLEAEQGGMKFKANDVVSQVKELLASPVIPVREKALIKRDLVDFLEQHGRKASVKKIATRDSRVLDVYGKPVQVAEEVREKVTKPELPSMSPRLVAAIKRFYQNRAKAAYQREGPSIAQASRVRFSEAMAGGAQRTLEQIPGVAERNLETQRLLGLERAIKAQVQRPAPPFEVFRPGTYPMVSRLLGHDVLSTGARVLNDPRVVLFARQNPRLFALLVQQLSAKPDATEQY
jgi:hypothetical protein